MLLESSICGLVSYLVSSIFVMLYKYNSLTLVIAFGIRNKKDEKCCKNVLLILNFAIAVTNVNLLNVL